MNRPSAVPVTDVPQREALIAWFRRNRGRSQALFDLLDPSVYYERPIALRNPIVFYEGHLPAFNVIVLVKRGLGRPGVDEPLETLFARGIDPESEATAQARGNPSSWPSRAEVQAYAARADALVEEALARAPIWQPGHPVLDRAAGAFTALEHEAMHQETLLYMWHRVDPSLKRAPAGLPPLELDAAPPEPRVVEVPAGRATLGARRDGIPFGWDNEFEAITVDVPAFAIDVHSVTNAQYLEFVEDGGYENRAWWDDEGWRWRETHGITHPLFWERSGDGWVWRTQFGRVPLPAAWPVYVSHAEACAYARWSGGRLPTEAEFHRAAYGTPDGRERAHPWGDEPPDASRGHFDMVGYDPVPAGSRPAGASAWGVHDLVGNGWEWTSSVFGPFPGFQAMAAYPEYSADFFDGQHFVLKGASPVTPAELIRRSFRNWFRANYPYVYAKFRCVR
ncbi:MAG TPA: SUMF1/EgtB/PvdO family nonheme iron enzyme [Vicinamibacterales bacterium]